jgi:alcohol dehydrogenase (cytochrome c)
MRGKSSWFVLATLLLSGTHALAQGNVAAGKTVFENQCASCHPVEPGKQGFGPSLAGVFNRQSGTLPGFTFTQAMTNAHLIWDAKTLDEFLASSTQKVPGTSMPVSLPNPAARADVIAYLDTLGQAAAPAATPATQAVIAPVGQGPSQDELLRAASDSSSWLSASKDYAGQRFVDLNQINAGNAAGLRAVCIYRSNNANPTQTNPLVYNGVMYLTIDQSIVAIDAATCRERWTYNWRVRDQVLSPTNRGVALKDGRVIRGTADGYLIAVDMEKGTPEPQDRRRGQEPVSQHATAHCWRPHHLRTGGRRLGCQELDRRLQA